MTVQQAKEMDMVDYLSALGYQPNKINGKNYWYLSPLHDEKTASFKVNRNLNRWYDFAEGKGGNLIDFGILFYKCGVSDLLQKLNSTGISITIFQKPIGNSVSENQDNHSIQILSVHEISSYPLHQYLQKRRISNDIRKGVPTGTPFYLISHVNGVLYLWLSETISWTTRCKHCKHSCFLSGREHIHTGIICIIHIVHRHFNRSSGTSA